MKVRYVTETEFEQSDDVTLDNDLIPETYNILGITAEQYDMLAHAMRYYASSSKPETFRMALLLLDNKRPE